MTKTKIFFVVAAAAFVSCSSDGNTAAPAQVANFADLGECNSYSEGVTRQVSADGLYYKCVAGSWQETEWEASNPSPVTGNTLYDSRDGHTYRTVTIGDQTWMAENLNYRKDGTVCPSEAYCETHNCYDYGGFSGDDHCSPLPDTTLWHVAGCYYLLNAALDACPQGWHLPSLDEWKILFEVVGGTDVAGKMLKASSGFCGDDGRSGNGIDAYGFNVRSTGKCSLLDWNHYHNETYYNKNDGLFDNDRDFLHVPNQNDYVINGVFPHCSLGYGAEFWTSTYLGKKTCKEESNFAPCELGGLDAYSSIFFSTEWHDDPPDDVDFPTSDHYKDYTTNSFRRLKSVRCVKDSP